MVEQSIRVIALLSVVLGATACKGSAPPRAPRRDISSMDVEAIDRELALNREELEAAGIYIPPAKTKAQEPPPAFEQPVPPAPEPELGGDVEEPQEAEEDAVVTEATDAPPAVASSEDQDSGAFRRRDRKGGRRFERAARRESADRCDRICDLADVTCDLEAQVCALAARHAHDIRYEGACERAELQCDAAGRECQLCAR